MSSVLRGKKDAPLAQACYIVRMDVNNFPVGSTFAAIQAGIAAAKADGKSVDSIGSNVIVAPAVYLADYFNGDVYLNAGDLLRDMGNELTISYQGQTYVRARLVQKVQGHGNTQGFNFSPSFYVTIWEAYGAGGVPNPVNGLPTSDIFVTRVS
jgi:hypothetical protein